MSKNEKPKAGKSRDAKKDRQQEMQEKYIELQVLKQQIASYVEQKQAIDEKESEMNATIEALKGLPAVKKGEEMWSSLGSGTFVRSDIKDVEKVMIAVGAGVVAKETLPMAIEVLELRVKELNEISHEIVNQANSLVERVNKLEPELEKLAAQNE